MNDAKLVQISSTLVEAGLLPVEASWFELVYDLWEELKHGSGRVNWQEKFLLFVAGVGLELYHEFEKLLLFGNICWYLRLWDGQSWLHLLSLFFNLFLLFFLLTLFSFLFFPFLFLLYFPLLLLSLSTLRFFFFSFFLYLLLFCLFYIDLLHFLGF